GLITAYYLILIQQGSQYTKEEFGCSQEYRVASYSGSISNRTEARQIIHSYLERRNISVPASSLQVIQIAGSYRVQAPSSLYSGRHCTFRKAGIQPPACIGKWFTLQKQTIKMEYGSPC
ncbi:MAG: hypothetical protein SVU32_04250, partial [Candidatus Nanohaloarchaea archaeon]|nr:hypothetical protein [Candidatus Nanohaloarchaea archaeon]